jgi:His/Glu/Gln/Arg/opine family amino acid ABC transporter permease subunit
MDFFVDFKESFYINFIKDDRYLYLTNGLRNTLIITFFALIIGVIIGLAIAIIKTLAEQKKGIIISFLNLLANLYLTVIRGTPVILQLLIINFIIFSNVNFPTILVAIIAFGINSGAYVAEIIRAGIGAVDKGQMEAGRSLGLTYSQTMRYIILPQAVKNVLPALGNESISLLKETAVAGWIAVEDLTKGGEIIRSRTYDAFMPLIAAGLVYLAIVIMMTKGLKWLERRLRQSEYR